MKAILALKGMHLMMVMELAVGRASQKSIALSFNALEPKGTKWHWYGWFGMAGNYLLMMFYTTIAGWLLLYFIKMAKGDFVGRDAAGVAQIFGDMTANPGIQNLTANLSTPDRWTLTGNGQANVSMKGFEFKSETKEYNDASRPSYRQVNDVDVDGAGIGGFGMAVDLGGVYKYNDDWTFSVALVDLGFINWKNNVQAVNNGEPFEFGGFNDMSVSHDNNGETIDDKFDDLGDQFTDFAHLKDEGDQGGRTTGIGATINLGAEYTLPVYKRGELRLRLRYREL